MGLTGKIKEIFTGKDCCHGCRTDTNVTRIYKPQAWAPREFGVKLIVAGNLRQSQEVSTAVMNVQREMATLFKKDFPDTKLLLSVDTFLDGARKTTGWSENPQDIGGIAGRWHCYQTDTRFAEAFDAMGRGDEQTPHVVMIFGNRFDDNPQMVAQTAKTLFETRGTQVYALPDPGARENVANAYALLTQNAGGMVLDIPRSNRQEDYAPIVSEVAKHSMYKASGQQSKYLALPEPANAIGRDVRRKLVNGPQQK